MVRGPRKAWSPGLFGTGACVMTGDRPDDPDRLWVRERLETLRARSQKSTSWRSLTHYLARLMNREGVVPVRARLTREDITFLASARDDMAAFCEMALRLLDLH